MMGSAGRSSGMKVMATAIAYGLLHAVVDGVCAALLASLKMDAEISIERLWTLFLIYNGLAFALQMPLGAMADYRGKYGLAMLGGAGLVGLGVLPWVPSVHAAIALVGIGNAAFHVGAGAMVLRISPERAAAAGLFVAPGSLGLVAGGWCGRSLAGWSWLGILVLAGVAVAVVLLQPVADRRAIPFSTGLQPSRRLALFAVGLLFVSVIVRSTVGMAVGAAYDGRGDILLGLACGGFLGKACGGVLADRFGWVKTSVCALALSAPFLVMDRDGGGLAIVGIFLFQMTMPVTLLAVYRVFSEEPGLAFGLPTLALFVGSLPVYVLPVGMIGATPVLLGLVVVSLVCLYVGLRVVVGGNR